MIEPRPLVPPKDPLMGSKAKVQQYIDESYAEHFAGIQFLIYGGYAHSLLIRLYWN